MNNVDKNKIYTQMLDKVIHTYIHTYIYMHTFTGESQATERMRELQTLWNIFLGYIAVDMICFHIFVHPNLVFVGKNDSN